MAARRFRFVSWVYVAVALIPPVPLVLVGVAMMHEAPWLAAFLVGIPLVLCVALLRRGIVSVTVGDQRLFVRRGPGWRREIVLPPAASEGEDPYRDDAESPANPRVRFEAGDHADFEERANPALARLTWALRLVLRFFSMGSPFRNGVAEGIEHDEAMTELSLRDAQGKAHRIIVPAQGKRNQAKLKALAEVLQAAGVGYAGSPTDVAAPKD